MSERGHFFAVDRRCWAKVCGLGLNPTVAYLVLARGTGGDQATTAWSAAAVERYTSISRHRAVAAIEALQTAKLVKRAGTPKRPIYTLVRPDGPMDRIWLPNTLIDGVEGDHAGPVELIRQTHDVPTLRLFVELYGAQYLPDAGGIDWRVIRTGYERIEIGEQGPFTVWGFRSTNVWTVAGPPDFLKPFLTGKLVQVPDERRKRDAGWDAFWPRWRTLRDMGLVETVPLLIDADTDEGEPLHPLGGDDIGIRIRDAADEAAEALMAEHQVAWTRRNDDVILVPAHSHMKQIAVVGIARMRYRARTNATAQWWLRQQTTAAALVDYYDAIEKNRSAGLGFPRLAISRVHQGAIKE